MKEKYVLEVGFYLPTNVCKSRWQLKDATQRRRHSRYPVRDKDRKKGEQERERKGERGRETEGKTVHHSL